MPERSISGFGGERDILRAWSRGLTPDLHVTISEWADRHRWLSLCASAQPGRYRTGRTPYMREIMDALSHGDPTTQAKGRPAPSLSRGSNFGRPRMRRGGMVERMAVLIE